MRREKLVQAGNSGPARNEIGERGVRGCNDIDVVGASQPVEQRPRAGHGLRRSEYRDRSDATRR